MSDDGGSFVVYRDASGKIEPLYTDTPLSDIPDTPENSAVRELLRRCRGESMRLALKPKSEGFSAVHRQPRSGTKLGSGPSKSVDELC